MQKHTIFQRNTIRNQINVSICKRFGIRFSAYCYKDNYLKEKVQYLMENLNNKEYPLISAIITTCKRAPQMLERAIDSIVSQTYRNIEIIVVDDSPDSFPERQSVKLMIDSFSGIKYICHSSNMGACAARNTGISVSAGEYLAFLDDDDEWLPDKIEKQVKKMAEDPCAGLVYCGSIMCNDETGSERSVLPGKHNGRVFDDLIFNNFIGSTSIPLIRKNALLDVGGFDSEQQSAQDYDVWLRIARKYNVACIEESLVRYHIHSEDQISKNPDKKIAGLERIIEKNMEYLRENTTALWIRTIKIAPFYSAKGDLKKALKVWMKAVSLKLVNVRKNFYYLLKIFKNYKKRSPKN